jgi:hypothetical protein
MEIGEIYIKQENTTSIEHLIGQRRARRMRRFGHEAIWAGVKGKAFTQAGLYAPALRNLNSALTIVIPLERAQEIKEFRLAHAVLVMSAGNTVRANEILGEIASLDGKQRHEGERLFLVAEIHRLNSAWDEALDASDRACEILTPLGFPESEQAQLLKRLILQQQAGKDSHALFIQLIELEEKQGN